MASIRGKKVSNLEERSLTGRRISRHNNIQLTLAHINISVYLQLGHADGGGSEKLERQVEVAWLPLN